MNTITKIGKYDVLEVIGKGGMGVVYKALDARIGRPVAIKMMTGAFAENPDFLKRFYREAQSIGTLQHPNIVIAYDLGDQDGSPYLVMEYLEGEPLDKLIASQRRVSLAEKLGIIIQVCNALNYAHQRGIVHRDVKPANTIVLKDGQVKIVDFGIARFGDKGITTTGQLVGSVSYMSPEQINGRVVDGRSDVFSAAVMLYELLTYRLPFEGKDTASVLLKITSEPHPPLRTFLPNAPQELEDIINRALAKNREERYATAEDVAFDLSRIQENLRRQMSDEYIGLARTFLGQSELVKAKELLQQVLKVDSQSTVAQELLHQVQGQLQKQQRADRVRHMRAQAEEALGQKLFDDALAYTEQALSLDTTNPELLQLRTLVEQAKAASEKVEKLLQQASRAQETGELEAAKKSLQEALRLDPENRQAKAMLVVIERNLAETSKQKEVQQILDEARKSISARQFTSALELLKKAQALDGNNPEVHAAMNIVVVAHEQQTRRGELEKFSSQIEKALQDDNYLQACSCADEALRKFPDEPGLLKLRALAEKQKEAGEKKLFIEEQTTAARKLLDAGKSAEALTLLSEASRKLPGNARIQSLLTLVRETAEREGVDQLKAKYLQQAKEAIRNKDYDQAVSVLETAQTEVEDSPEIRELLHFAREERTNLSKRGKVQAALVEAQRLMAEENYEGAAEVLQSTLRECPDDDLRVAFGEARRQAEDFSRRVDQAVNKAERLLNSRKLEEAVSFLESQPKSFARSIVFCNALEKAREEQTRCQNVQKAVAAAKARLDKGDFNAGLSVLESCRKTYGDSPELEKAQADFESRRSAIAKNAVETALADARTLLLSRQYPAALARLEQVTTLVNSAPADLQKQHTALKKDASSGAVRLQKDSELSETIVAGSRDSAPTRTTTSGAGTSAAMSGRVTSDLQPQATIYAPAGVRSARPGLFARHTPLVIAILAVVALSVPVYRHYQQRILSPVATTYVELNAVPWGTVRSISSMDGKLKLQPNEQTPMRISVPPGEYTVEFAGPNGERKAEQLKATNEQPASCTAVFEAIDVEKIINSY